MENRSEEYLLFSKERQVCWPHDKMVVTVVRESPSFKYSRHFEIGPLVLDISFLRNNRVSLLVTRDRVTVEIYQVNNSVSIVYFFDNCSVIVSISQQK